MSKQATWDAVWIDIAIRIAKESRDERFKVGCVIVPDDNSQILSLGINGNARGLPNVPDSTEPGKSNWLHAEQNAYFKLDYRAPGNKTLYVSHSPCLMCAKGAIQCNIKRVVYEIEYRDLSGLDVLRSVGIDVVKFVRA